MKFAKKFYQLWIASSMGQKAIERKFTNRIFIKDFKKILNFLNLDKKSYQLLPSMYPDINIGSDKKENIDNLIKKFLEIKFLNNKNLINIRYRKNPNKVNFILGTYHKKENYIIYKGKEFHFCELGLEYGSDQIGTGYHTPNGILLTLGEKSSKLFKDKEKIDTKIFTQDLQIYENK